MLSNTAVPIYYGQFRDKVESGEIPVCREIEMEMNRIDKLIEDPNFYYNDKAINGWIKFCESELTLTDGSPLKLLDSFKLWAEEVIGWYYYVSKEVPVPDNSRTGFHYETKKILKRLTRKQYLIVTRGAAKSMYDACWQAYELVINKATTHQVSTAPTMIQANEVLSPIQTAISRTPGPLFKFMTMGSINNTTGSKDNRPLLASTKKGIQNFLTNSLLEIRPMTINKLQGLRLKMATVDEWLSGDISEDVIGALEQGASKIQGGNDDDDYLIIATSSEGTVRNGVGDTIKIELNKILKGEYEDPGVSIWYYKLDEKSEVHDPSAWLKANPNLGITVSYDTYATEVKRAENNPAARNDILAKRFNLPMEGFTYFFTYEETLPHREQDFSGMPCTIGVDLSRGNDFCAFTFLFPLSNGDFGVKTRCYISELTSKQLPLAQRQKYETFIHEGSLVVMDGNILDMELVYSDLDAFIQHPDVRYDVRAMGYDPYNAPEFIKAWIKDNGEYNIEKVIQGARTESVPLGELKKLASVRALIFDQAIMTYTMGNCIVETDSNANMKLTKERYSQKIDAVSGLMDAFVAYKLHREEF